MGQRHRRRWTLTALCGVALLAVPTVPTGVGAAESGVVTPQVVPTTLEAVGSIPAPSYDGGQSGNIGVAVSPNHENLVGVTYGYLLELDVPSMAATDGAVLGGAPAVWALSSDRSDLWVGYYNYTAGEFEIESLELDTGLVSGSPFGLGVTNGNKFLNSLTVASIGGTEYAFAGFTGWPYYSTDPEIVSVNLTTGATSSTGSLLSQGFGRGNGFGLEVATDGSELYAARGDQVMVFDPADLSLPASRSIALTGASIGHFDDGVSTLGKLYVADGDLKIYDLDSETTIHTVTLPGAPFLMDVSSVGDVALGGPNTNLVSHVDAATGTLTNVDLSPVLLENTSAFVIGLAIDEDPTYGTCIYTSNNYDSSFSAISVDGADCGPFAGRIDPIDPVVVDGSSTVTYDAPGVGDRAAEWSAIAVYANCALVELIEPPFSGSFTVDWADVNSGTTLSVRAYTAADLTAGSITDLSTLTCDTPTNQRAETNIEYLPLGAERVGAGGENSCASSSGDAFCWGDNYDGQLGDGTDLDRYVATPVASPGIEPTPTLQTEGLSSATISEIDSGDAHTCALAGGVLYCWGDNGDGQLGIGDADSSSTPVAVAANDGFLNTAVTAFSVGDAHTCAVESGAVYCWGYNSYDQIGDDSTDYEVLLASKVADVPSVFTNSGVTGVAAGFDHSCAISAGSVYCWGGNGDGELGDGSETDSSVAVKVVNNPSEGFTNSGVTQVVASDESTCAIASGSVFCWGYDDYGKLGWDDAGDSSSPVKVLPNAEEGFVNNSITWITAGEDHICAIRAAVAYCWGYNSDGQLGWNTGDDSGLPGRVADVDGGFVNEKVTDIDAGFRHTCAIADGLVYCWGDNGSGRLGNGGTLDSDVAVPVCCRAASTQFNLRVRVSGEGSVTSNVGGIDCSDDCTETFDEGTTVRLTARPAAGQVFTGWSGACSGTGRCTVTMSQNRRVTANFAEAVELEVVIPDGGGSVQVDDVECTSTCTVDVGQDTLVSLTPTPAAGYVFVGWEGACSGTGPCVVSLAAAGSVTARFALATIPATGAGAGLVRMGVVLVGIGIGLAAVARRRPRTA